MDDPRRLAADFDLDNLPDDFYADPFRHYAALREHAPVKQLGPGRYLLTRYADCAAVYADSKTFSSDKKVEFKPKYGDTALYEHHTTSLVFNDAPLHTRVRKLIMGALIPRAINAMEPGLVLLVDHLLDRIEEKAARGEAVDLIEDFAAAIPVEIIGNLLAVPQAERGPLRGRSLAILGALEPRISPEQLEAGDRAVREFLAYLETLVADRTRHPGNPETDVLTRLIQGEVDGEKLKHHELLQNCIFILNAGHETTTNLIGNALVLLANHPDQRARLIAEPDLLRTAIEEVLRYESSNQLGNRSVAVATEIGGVAMPVGTLITICIGAANRDPEIFPEPDRFDIARTPNRHLAFAGGVHQCAGMNVARMEARIALGAFLKRFPNYALDGAPQRSRRARFRGFMRISTRPA